MVGRCKADRLAKFPNLIDFIVDLVSGYGPGVTILCAGYGHCDLLEDSCDWKAMQEIASVPDVVDSVHFYDPGCPDTSGFRDAVQRDFGSVNGRVCETENGLLETYDFVMYFGAFEDDDSGLLDVYRGRTNIAFVHVRIPGLGRHRPEDIFPARKMFMERYLDHPPETTTGLPDPKIRDMAYEMQDRPYAFVDLYSRENDFERENHRFDRAETADDRAFRSHLGAEAYDNYYAQDGGARARKGVVGGARVRNGVDGGARARKGVVGALAMVTLIASLAMSAMA